MQMIHKVADTVSARVLVRSCDMAFTQLLAKGNLLTLSL